MGDRKRTARFLRIPRLPTPAMPVRLRMEGSPGGVPTRTCSGSTHAPGPVKGVEFLRLITCKTDALKADFTGPFAVSRRHHVRVMSVFGDGCSSRAA